MMPQPPIIHRLHHFAWRCRNAEETRQFYEDVLGLPLVHVIQSDTVPSTGELCPYVHLFFRLMDGSNIAFFDLGDDQVPEPSANTPSWVIHFAMQVGSEADLLAAKDRLEQNGVDVVGVTDHGFVKSIYFFDPNGLRLELTVATASTVENATYEEEARIALDRWTCRDRQRHELAQK